MRILSFVLLIGALACCTFAYWGLETPSGRQAYDEMAGMVPMAAGVAGVIFFVAAVAIWFWGRISTRKQNNRRPA